MGGLKRKGLPWRGGVGVGGCEFGVDGIYPFVYGFGGLRDDIHK